MDDLFQNSNDKIEVDPADLGPAFDWRVSTGNLLVAVLIGLATGCDSPTPGANLGTGLSRSLLGDGYKTSRGRTFQM